MSKLGQKQKYNEEVRGIPAAMIKDSLPFASSSQMALALLRLNHRHETRPPNIVGILEDLAAKPQNDTGATFFLGYALKYLVEHTRSACLDDSPAL